MANAAFNMKLLSSISAFERDCQVFYDDDDDDDGADYDSNFLILSLVLILIRLLIIDFDFLLFFLKLCLTRPS